MLTSNEKQLIIQIDKEIKEMYEESFHILDKIDITPEAEHEKKDDLYNKHIGLSKGISKRSSDREKIIKEAWDRLKHNN